MGDTMHSKRFEMGLDLRDIDRTMPQACGDYELTKVGTGYELQNQNKAVKMIVEAAPPRVIAGLSLPVSKVELQFKNHSKQNIEDFIFRFMRHFHRGGG